uniref:Reverse transcriptase domain-containing protein n=1 Tax=Trichogramma kaykai TaxID=54128 RepID=A0ABD2XP53_9HYME
MLDTAGKILERIICNRLEVFTEAPDGLSDHQHGFQRGRSTTGAIESFTAAAREAVGGARGSRKYCAVVTLDVRNAFNSARWNNILAALERIRTPEYLQRIIYSYFQARVLEYNTDDGPESCSITAGVPQRSVLGPILWNVMYDTILRLRLDEGVRVVGFADDIAVVAVAGTTYEVEDLLSCAIARVREALWGLGLETADHKTEALLISRKRRLETITIEVDDCFIASSPCIRYLGLQLDARLSFNDHLIAASEKASRVAGALSQIMPIIGGPRSSRRWLYVNVIDSILLYSAPIWSHGAGTLVGMRRAEATHRRACLRVISGRPHLSYDATYVLASIPPLALLADERSRLYQRHHEDARAEERQETLRRWQSRWDRSTKGRWTHRLIPNISLWIDRRHGEVDYHLTQLLTGHGYFKHHSQRYDHNASAGCPACPNTVENAEHVFFHCTRFEEGREKLHRQLQEVARPENIVQLMLADKKTGSRYPPSPNQS